MQVNLGYMSTFKEILKLCLNQEYKKVQKMKQLKFEHHFAREIIEGKKTVTFRVNDDKDLRVGDKVELVDKVDSNHPKTWTIPGILTISDIESVPLKELTKNQLSSAESFDNLDEMLQSFRRFYGEHISMDSEILVLHFDYEQSREANFYLEESNNTGVYAGVGRLYADGGSRGNPGPSAAGFVVLDEQNRLLHSDNKYLGITTNNQAEYHALIQGMEWCLKERIPTLYVYLDSLLVVNQLKGIFRVKNRDLWTLYESAKELSGKFNKFTVTHVPRELNKLADAEVNKALDAVKGSDIVQ
jgi:ribonuclease HI